jgi:arginine/lysine/ornithine decarboxylase
MPWSIPNKLMLLTPGIDRKTGEYLDFGVPATVLANYLREQRIVPEKCDLNSILFLMTPAEDESKLNSLLAKLVKVQEPVGSRRAARPRCCRPSTRRTRSATPVTRSARCATRMHAFYREANIKQLQKAVFRAESFPSSPCPRRTPTRSWWPTKVDYVPMTKVQGRIAATLALIYPPVSESSCRVSAGTNAPSPCWITS